MTEEQIKSTVRSFLKTSTAGDVNQALSYLAPDASVTIWGLTFKGTAEIKKFLNWMTTGFTDNKIEETGMGVICVGNTGVVEHDISGTTKGKRVTVPTVCIYDFKGDKIQSIRGFSDRLNMAQQAASGFFPKWMVNKMVNTTEKGLK